MLPAGCGGFFDLTLAFAVAGALFVAPLVDALRTGFAGKLVR